MRVSVSGSLEINSNVIKYNPRGISLSAISLANISFNTITDNADSFYLNGGLGSYPGAKISLTP